MSGKFRLLENWKPRDYQKPALNAWIRDGVKNLELIWHRRAGKDTICMMGTAIMAFKRVANYVHMLPQENQARGAIWDAVNPHTGKRKIDEAFPLELRAKTNDQKMMITFINGSTWQLFGSDNYHKAIGSTPAGIVWSEWSLSNPSSETYLDPILAENNGWKFKIGTMRGKNHAYHSYKFAQKEPDDFAELLTVEDTGMDKVFDMPKILRKEQAQHGEALGKALVLQEYYCSAEAAVVGAVWGSELSMLERNGRLCDCPHDSDYPVFTAWDIGRTDSTAIWFYQVISNEVKFIDFVEDSLKNPDYFASQVLGIYVSIDIIDDEIVVKKGGDLKGAEHRQSYQYETHWLPHDARAKTFAAMGKSAQELLSECLGWNNVQITPNLSKQDQIQAARKMILKSVMDWRCETGFEAVKQYRYEQDEKNKKLKDKPLHDWTSHAADALMYAAVTYETLKPEPIPKPPDVAQQNKIPARSFRNRKPTEETIW
jgi:uncharacterized protein YbcI